MQITNASIFVLLAVGAVLACKPSGDEIDPGQIAETGSDEGLFMPDIDLPSSEDADPVYLPPGECVQESYPNVYGYVHQCEGGIRLSYTAKDYAGEISFGFGPGELNAQFWVDPDNYEMPLVAACCGAFDYPDPTFEQKAPYLNNCLLDAVQQTCHGIPYFLRHFAEQTDKVLEKAALNGLANDVEDQAGACLLGLWGGGPTDEAPNRIVGTSWSPKNAVTFNVVEVEVTDWTEEGEVTWGTCESIHDNDPSVVPTAPFRVPGTVGTSQSILGPGTTVRGSGPAGSFGLILPSTSTSSLTLAHLADGSLVVSGMRLDAGASRITVNDETVELVRSSVILRNVMEPRTAGREHIVGAGDASFVVTAVFAGDSRIVDFTNDGPIVFRRTPSDAWQFDPFTLIRTDSGGEWTLSFSGLHFIDGR